ncbi:substrate-binding periplasmic protein [Paucibacter sp. Y2R2-4]|uniref:substrate-binding periplasmic protein n=1 Tax=Paucibacter sp. Y2R2-4 TaxID=2893553 RepID=UPI0021E4E20C|nr:transporter substrate-binding domain-containing protein [Paucibacter sp. Y2R2-4]MCV2350267.1 transporter substrate-binding domain-containing protein [Paucibacter sp. Y2R2-4]
MLRQLLHGAAACSALGTLSGQVLAQSPAQAPSRLQVPIAVNEASRRPFVKHILRLIGEAAQIEWQIQPLPWARAMLLAERGQLMVFGVSRTPAREQVLSFSEPVFDNHVWMVVRRDQAMDYRQLSDLSGRTLCVSRGTSYGPSFEAARGSLFKVELANGDLNARVRMLMAGRCDVMLSSHRSAQPWLFERLLREESGHSAAVSVLPTPLQVDPIHFAVARDHPLAQALPRLNAAMRQQAKAIQALVNSDL